MGFWDRFTKKPAESDDTSKTVEARPAPSGSVVPKELSLLLHAGLPNGPTDDECLAAFHAIRNTPEEARAVEELTRSARTRTLPDPLLVALGATLVDRGEPEGAERVLEAASSSPALLLLADLAERRGATSRALSIVERVLLRDLDHPGARERHRRWRAQLGFDVPRDPIAASTTVVAAEADAPFDLLREVGRGGAAAVYQAIDRELGRHVALKVYHNPERDRSQLAHEARVAVALEGAGIVRVFDVDPEHGWIALEWAPAGALREQIRGREVGRLVPLDRWALPLAEALARVHGAGWVHHDVKPANVLLSRTNAAILTDFGTARRIGEPSPPGSLGYMSPERMRGRPSDPLDDIYGFGRVLEDALAAIEGSDDRATVARYRSMATACTGPDEQRPAHGAELVARFFHGAARPFSPNPL